MVVKMLKVKVSDEILFQGTAIYCYLSYQNTILSSCMSMSTEANLESVYIYIYHLISH